MRTLIHFILRNGVGLVSVILIIFSFFLVFSYNSYHRSIYLSSANVVTSNVYRISNNIISFFYLKQENKSLNERNAQLQNELETIKSRINRGDSVPDKLEFITSDSVIIPRFNFTPAKVINISISGGNNFITLDKGKNSNIKPDMGVVSAAGVVGTVLSVSSSFAVVIPIINPKFKISAKIKNSPNSGSLSWDRKDNKLAQLSELPNHEEFKEGDTIVTSYSRIFPKDVIIGYVKKEVHSSNDNFKILEIELVNDFQTLQEVLVINDNYYKEQQHLEESIDN